MKQPKVSFIIPYYNSGLTIDETISSIQNQSYKNFDIWLIDDGSTDAFSIKKLEELKNIENITILHIPNSGPGIARNIAIEKTNSEFIVPLDADDLIESNSISEAVIKMNDYNKIGAVFGNIRLFGNESKTKIQSFRDMKTQLIYNQLAITALIRKQVFETVGYYDEFLSKPGLEDWEFWIRFSNSEWDLDYISTIFLSVRINQNSRTFVQANKNIEKIKEYVFKKHIQLLADNFESLYYDNKQLKETPDFRIGNTLLKPYRFIKTIFKK